MVLLFGMSMMNFVVVVYGCCLLVSCLWMLKLQCNIIMIKFLFIDFIIVDFVDKIGWHPNLFLHHKEETCMLMVDSAIVDLFHSLGHHGPVKTRDEDITSVL